MKDDPRTRRSILRTSGTVLATAGVGIGAVGTASASYFGEGQHVSPNQDGVPCWYPGDEIDGCSDLEDFYEMPDDAVGVCQENQQEWSCGTYVLVDDIDFNLAAYINTSLLEHENRES